MLRRKRKTEETAESFIARHRSMCYRLDYRLVPKGPKCPYCDEKGYLTYTAPNGDTKRDFCPCRLDTKRLYHVEEIPLISLTMSDREVVLRYHNLPDNYTAIEDEDIDPVIENGERPS